MTDFNQARVLQILHSALMSQQELIQAVLKQLDELQQNRAEQQWVSLESAVKALGPVFTERKVKEDIKAGFLFHGEHYIDVSNGKNPRYALKIAAVRKLYETPPEKRRSA